jgi:hypothetical protein
MWRRVFWWKFTDVSEKHTGPHLNRNSISNVMLEHTESHTENIILCTQYPKFLNSHAQNECEIKSFRPNSLKLKLNCNNDCLFPLFKLLLWIIGKAIPLQAWTGPEGSRSLRIPDFKTIGTWRWEVVSRTHRPPLPPRKYSWYSFLLEAESTTGP